MKTQGNLLTYLNSIFNRLNKEYMALDKQLDIANESESLLISEKMEYIQTKMTEISQRLENYSQN